MPRRKNPETSRAPKRAKPRCTSKPELTPQLRAPSKSQLKAQFTPLPNPRAPAQPDEDMSFQEFANQIADQLARNEKLRIDRAIAKLKTEIFPKLKRWGVAMLKADYSGYGDSGCIDELGYFDRHDQPVNMDMVRSVSDPEILSVLYEFLPDGFETGEGGQGDLTIDVEAGTVKLEHQENYTETRDSTDEWEV